MNVKGHSDGPPVAQVGPQGSQDLRQIEMSCIGQAAATWLENPGSEKGKVFVKAYVFLCVRWVGEDQINAVIGKITIRVSEIAMMKSKGRIMVGFDLFQTLDHSPFLYFHLPFFNRFGQCGIFAGQQANYYEILNVMIFYLGQFEQGSGLGSKRGVAKLVSDYGRKILSDPFLLDDGIHADSHLISKILEGWKFSIGVGSSSRTPDVSQFRQDLITRKKVLTDFNVVEFVAFEVFVQFNESRPSSVQFHYLAVDCCAFKEFGRFQTVITGQKHVVRGDGDGVNQSDLVDGLCKFHDFVRIKTAKTFTDSYLFHWQRFDNHGTMMTRAHRYVQINIRIVIRLTSECEIVAHLDVFSHIGFTRTTAKYKKRKYQAKANGFVW